MLRTVTNNPRFTLKTGTIFEDSPIALEKWLPATWMLVNCKNGISHLGNSIARLESLRRRHGSCFSESGLRRQDQTHNKLIG